MGMYRITWSIDTEADNAQEAVEECWNRLQENHNEWIWDVDLLDEDGKPTESYEVDYENWEGEDTNGDVIPSITIKPQVTKESI